ncbi:MAG TPA: hypothetical protein VHS34_03295 [Terriglobales bacterium]|nr:hypothetical protein [Terriglobales bacterium]
MAVFIAASDETSGGNALSTYLYSGWVMPESDWFNCFTPAWQERVLDGPPKIPFLHMTDMRKKTWREKWKVTELDADERMDEAARVIDHMGSMYPVTISIDGEMFQSLYKTHKFLSASGGVKDFQPDFLAFLPYVYVVLLNLNKRNPEAEKVDFMVENNSQITKHIYELYQAMAAALTHIGASNLIPLLGGFLPVDKTRVPVQAADYLCWHARRAKAETLTDKRDLRRWNTISHRTGVYYEMERDVMFGLAEAFNEYGRENEKPNGVREVRQYNAKNNEYPARRDKSKAGRGKGGKKAEA